MRAWRARSGGITFNKGDAWSDRPLDIPCSQCIGCRITKSREWAIRCVHEAQTHEENTFATLTYNDEHLPPGGSLNLRDWTLFAKRLRKKRGHLRYFQCGEYGDEDRAHHHAILFGIGFRDKVKWRYENNNWTYLSQELSDLWGKGFITIGDVSFQSAAYVARYTLKKLTPGQTQLSRANFKNRYERIDTKTGEVVSRKPEYATMSRAPGIGSAWLKKYRSDVYPSDEVIHKGKRFRPPSFYDEQLDEEERKIYKAKRLQQALKHEDELTGERLEIKEYIQQQKINLLKRNIKYK